MNGFLKYLVGFLVLLILFPGCEKTSSEESVPKPGQAVTIEMSTDSQPAAFLPDPATPPRVRMVLAGHQGDVTGLAFTKDGRYLVSVSYGDYSLRVWNTADGRELANARTPNRVRSMAVTPDGKTVITADAYNKITWWSLEDGTIGPPVTSAIKAGDNLAISVNGAVIATTGYNLPVRLWNAGFPKPFKNLDKSEHHRVLTFSKSGKYLAAGGLGNRFSIWDTASWNEKHYTISNVGKDSEITAISISPNERCLATGHNDSSIVLFDLEEREERHNFYVAGAATRALIFSPDSKRLVTVQQDKKIYIWDSKTARGLAQLQYHSQPVVCLAFGPGGNILASGGEDRKIVFWGSGTSAETAPAVTAADSADTGDSGTVPASVPTIEPAMVDGKRNYINAPNASTASPYWTSEGETAIETDDRDNPIFVLRYGGMFQQDTAIGNAAGKYVLVIAWAASGRANPGEDQTGYPHLYGCWLNKDDPQKIEGYLNGESMMLRPTIADEWGLIYGIFQVPGNGNLIRFFMQQADGSEPQNGSAARFDEPGVFLFDTREEAIRFMKNY